VVGRPGIDAELKTPSIPHAVEALTKHPVAASILALAYPDHDEVAAGVRSDRMTAVAKGHLMRRRVRVDLELRADRLGVGRAGQAGVRQRSQNDEPRVSSTHWSPCPRLYACAGTVVNAPSSWGRGSPRAHVEESDEERVWASPKKSPV
jgi:hypothetical protein